MGTLTELVSKARKGSADARTELEEHLRPLVHGVLLAWVPHALAGPQVRGLISDAFGAILSEDAKFVPTLLARVRSSGQNLARQRADVQDPTPPDAGMREALATLERLRKLPERERERISMRLIEGIAGPELCEAFGASEAEVGADLEKGLALLQEGGGAQSVQLKNDPYLWNLSATPHPVVVRFENLLTRLRYDDSALPHEREVETNPVGVPPVELTPSAPGGPVPAPVEGRRGTSEFKPPAPSRPPLQRASGLKPALASSDPRKSSANLAVPAAVSADPRKSGANLGTIPSNTSVRNSMSGAKPPEGPVTSAPPVRAPERTDPPSAAFLLPKDEDDDEFDERTEALVPMPGRSNPAAPLPNPFAQQPRTIAAPDLPAAAAVNPYAGMPGTVAANDLPPAARTNAGVAPPPVPSASIPAGKRPTGAHDLRGVVEAVPPPGPESKAAARSLHDDDLDEQTGTVEPRVIRDAQARVSTAPAEEAATRQQTPLGDGEENPTRVQPIKAPVHWKSVLFAEDDDEASITLPVPERNKFLRKKGVWVGKGAFTIAFMLGTLGLAIGWVTIESSERRATRMWNLVEVTVAAADLDEGTVVTQDKLSKRFVPEQFATASVVRPDTYSYIINQKLLVPVQAGDPLLWSHFELAQATERLSKRVQRRSRAISVSTGMTTSVGGWVRPGDWVDLIVSLADGPKGNSRAAVTLMQDVPVIATGKITEKTNYGILSNSQRTYMNVSLLLLPEEAEMVTLAATVGNFRLTLRNEVDHDVNRDGYGSNAKTLLDGARVKLLQMRRLATIQAIRDAPTIQPTPVRLRIEPNQ